MREITTDGRTHTIPDTVTPDADLLLRYIASTGGIAHYESINGYFRQHWGVTGDGYKKRISTALRILKDEGLLTEPGHIERDAADLPPNTYKVTSLGNTYLVHAMTGDTCTLS